MTTRENDLKGAISLLIEGEEDFESLVRTLKLKPNSDFRYTDLSSINFGDADLAGFDFTGANLRNANLSEAKIEGLILNEAELDGVQWPSEFKKKKNETIAKVFTGYIGNYKWEAVSKEMKEYFISTLSPVDGKYSLTREETEIEVTTLSWYDNVSLLRITDPRWQNFHLSLYYLVFDNDRHKIFRLSGSSPAIHEVNAKAPISLKQENALDYLRFFCYFVRGEEGPFYILEDLRDLTIPQHHGLKQIIKDVARPATLKGINEKGQFLCDAVVYYSNAVFIAEFAINPTGMIEMLDDEPIAADLPGKLESPIN